jgi:hypothetical protein
MKVDKPLASESDMVSEERKSHVNAIMPLKLAMSSLSGHADSAFLGQIHQIAVDQFGFGLSMEEAADVLAQIPGVRLERAPLIEQSRVFAAEYWKP